MVMPMLVNLTNIISLPYLGSANQIQEAIIHEISLLSFIIANFDS
jgi:hypothetical protein